MEKRMKREANTNDMPLTFYSSLPRIFYRQLRPSKPKSLEFAIQEVRLGSIMLYFAGAKIVAFAWIYPKDRSKDNVELIFEQYAMNSAHGRATAEYLERNEVIFDGDKFQFISSGHAFHANLHRALATESMYFIESRVEQMLDHKADA